LRFFKRTDIDYTEIVTFKESNTKEYDINCNKLKVGDKVVCPFDPDMIVTKNENDEIILVKQSYKNPYRK
jgi:hypothetical protein